jgi:hypothetical protein
MADQFDVEVNTTQFEASMRMLRAGVRKGFIDPGYGTLTVQGRLLSERCQDFTPPRDVAQGRKAVTRDIMAIYFPLSQTTFKDNGIKKIVRTDNRPAWDAVATKFSGSHNLRNTKAIGFTPEWHQKNRDRRGRGFRAKYGNLGVVTLGPEARKAREYLKGVKKLVGWARAGWNMGIVALGGHVKQPWVGRHGVARGFLEDGRSTSDPYIRVVNDTGWAKNSSEGVRILRNAIAARARDMESYANRMMNLAAKKSGF